LRLCRSWSGFIELEEQLIGTPMQSLE